MCWGHFRFTLETLIFSPEFSLSGKHSVTATFDLTSIKPNTNCLAKSMWTAASMCESVTLTACSCSPLSSAFTSAPVSVSVEQQCSYHSEVYCSLWDGCCCTLKSINTSLFSSILKYILLYFIAKAKGSAFLSCFVSQQK